MTSKIHILQPDLANKIAAGEVVQRPASVVKELIENALDAGARSVTVTVKDAGRSFIQVVDDGEGMSYDDALLAFQRHATSKIATAQDLEAIRTLGFRGEALASIAAVSQVELKTRRREDETATLVRIDGNELKEHAPAQMEPGTSVVVRNLFYNTPGRRNFLKTRTTELKNITDVVTRMAIVFPELGWLYASDGEVLLDLKPKPHDDRLRDVFGTRLFDSLVKVSEVSDSLTLEGYIGRPDFARKSRAEQFLYINRRFILNKAISHAVFQAYEHLLEKGTFPFFFLNIGLDPHKVDVNVHPSKLEVKFENESNLYRFVLSALRKTLSANDLVPDLLFRVGTGLDTGGRLSFGAPSLPGGGRSTAQPVWPQEERGRQTSAAFPTGGEEIEIERLLNKVDRRLSEDTTQRDGEATFPGAQKPGPASQRERLIPHRPIRGAGEAAPATESRMVWQIHNKYILSQLRSGLLIVDQHVAHERILYERALANFENSLPSTQQLLFPHTVQLSPSDYSLAKDLMADLQRLGFDIQPFGKNTVVLEGIPADVRVGDEAGILQEVLDEFKNNEHNQSMDARDRLAKSFACKAAVKAGDRLSSTEMLVLIDQLFATSMPYVCPHGRPVVVKISIDELDRRFGRT